MVQGTLSSKFYSKQLPVKSHLNVVMCGKAVLPREDKFRLMAPSTPSETRGTKLLHGVSQSSEFVKTLLNGVGFVLVLYVLGQVLCVLQPAQHCGWSTRLA